MTDRRKAWLLKAMMITASASVLAACQTTSPYVERRQAESAPAAPPPAPAYTPPAPGSAPEAAPPAAAPSGTISTQPLPPVESAYTPPAAPAYTPPAAPAYTPPPAPAYTPPPPPAPVRTRTIPAQYKSVTTGKVVDADGPPKVYTVKSGDALDAIAREMGLTRKELADLNDLKSPYRLQPGQKLTGPKSTTKAYTVASGDTLSAVGRRFSVSAKAIAEANNISLSATLRAGQKLVLPAGYKDLGPQRVLVAPATTVEVPAPSRPAATTTPPRTAPSAPTTRPPAQSAPATQPPSSSNYSRPAPAPASSQPQPQPSTSVYSRPTPTPPPATPPAPRGTSSTPAPVAAPLAGRTTPAQLQALGRGQFIWPLRGRIITSFGTMGTAQRSDGINIAAPVGTTVRASAGGTVLYAGPLPQYGNLVLIQHANGFVSVYAHLSRILVKTQASVRQNQEIGEVGQTGDAAEPQLYFEMRHLGNGRDKPDAFDPILVLPR